AARRGDEVILPRNTHISAIQLCAVAGLVPAFASPSYTAAGRPYTTPESYLRAMEEHPRARGARGAAGLLWPDAGSSRDCAVGARARHAPALR
ncbi:MAG: hypothetical protein RR065_00875, partial [Clostridia bacterium]